MQFDQDETARLHRALEREREALVTEAPYDRDAPPLPSMREAQRQALRTGLQGRSHEGEWPTVSIEAYQVSED
jgi:hypothetical protein